VSNEIFISANIAGINGVLLQLLVEAVDKARYDPIPKHKLKENENRNCYVKEIKI
jgi:hypothetical protein